MKNVLVTGGAGFIGSNFVRHFLRAHPEVTLVNFDALTYAGNLENLVGIDAEPHYHFVRGDICDRSAVDRALKEFAVDTVVHFAAESHVDRSIMGAAIFIKTNVLGTQVLLEAAKEHAVERFLHVSTDEVYGDVVREGSFRETDALRPSSPYSASKAAADVFVLGYARTYDLQASITRCTNNYGPFQFPEKLIPKTIIRASLGLKVPLYGSGRNVRDWIHVEDHCRAVEMVLNHGRPGEIYNISSKTEKTNLEVVKTILGIMDKSEETIEFVDDRPGHDVRYSLDSSKIEQDLKWKTKRSFEQGLHDTVRWYGSHETWWKPLADDKVLSPTPWRVAW